MAGFANIPGIAIGLAIVTVIGRCIGAGEKEQARYYSKRLLGLAYAGMVLADLALFVLVKPIIACFALSAEAARIATQLLVSFAVCAALLLGGLLTTDLTGVPHGRLVLSVASVIIGHRKTSFPAGQPMRSATHAITSR